MRKKKIGVYFFYVFPVAGRNEKKNQIKLDKIFEKNKIFKNEIFVDQNDLLK